jgi:hypothetical protein
LRIVTQKSDRCVVSIKNGDAALQFRNHRIVAVKAGLAGLYAPKLSTRSKRKRC